MNEVDTIYNRYGKPEIIVMDDGSFVSFTSKRLGFFLDDHVYNYKGQHLGWFEGGILRDHWGNVVGFGENPSDYPIPFLPFKQFKPFAAFPEFEPFRPSTAFPPFKPLKTFSWSVYTPLALFWGNRS